MPLTGHNSVAAPDDDEGMRWTGILACVVMVLTAAPLQAEDTVAGTPVRMRVYPQTFVAPAEWQRAQEELARIFAGIHKLDTVVCDSRHAGGQHNRCSAPLDERELLVRLSPLGRSDHRVLGSAVPSVNGGAGRLASVYVNNVRATARAVGIDFGILLGRVTAHEMGHLILGAGSHSQQGLMRRLWLAQDLRKQGPQWDFAPTQRARIGFMERFLTD